MVELPRLGVIVGLVVAFSVLGPAWPAPAEHPLAVAPLSGVIVAALLGGERLVLLLALAGIAVAAALTGGPVAPWVVATAAPLAAASMARLRHGWRGVATTSEDALEILGVALGAAFLAAALAGALGLPQRWGVAVGLGVLAVAPPLGRVLGLLTPRVIPMPVPVPAKEQGTVPARQAGLRVLVVEDDAVNRLVAQEILRAAGHHVTTAADGLEGLRQATVAEPPFDAVLLDLHMPGLDGTDVLRRVRALSDPQRARVPILLLSADVTPSARARGLAAGADDFLTKPVEAEALLAALAAPRRPAEPLAAAVHEVPLSADAAVDLDLLEGRLGDLGRDSLGRILGLFQDAAPRHLARLREYAGTGDAVALRREAHTLKGAAAVIGATRLCEAASDIERAADDAQRVAVGLDRLAVVIEASLAAVGAFARRRDVPGGRGRPIPETKGPETAAPQETSGANT